MHDPLDPSPKQSIFSSLIPSSRRSQYISVPTQEGAISLPPSDDEENEVVPKCSWTWTPRAAVKRWGTRTTLLWSFIISLIIGLLVFGICMAVIRPNRRACYYVPQRPHTGLENVPRFNESFECLYYSTNVQSSQNLVRIPLGADSPLDHAFTITGNSTGVITLASAPAGVDEVVYDFTYSASPSNRFEEFKFRYPSKNKDGSARDNYFIFETPQRDGHFSSLTCSRYSVTIYIPKILRSFSLLSHTDTQIQFSPGSQVELDLLNITMTSSSLRNLILPHTSIHSKKLIIDAADAWVVGSISLVEEVDISASHHYGVTSKVDIYPSLPTNFSNPEPAILRTWSGYGNMSIAYIASASYIHRPIESKHISAVPYGGSMSFEYTGANFNGLLDIRTSSLYARGVYPLNQDRKFSEYTHFVGDANGMDRLLVKSSGYVQMWFPGDYLRPVGRYFYSASHAPYVPWTSASASNHVSSPPWASSTSASWSHRQSSIPKSLVYN